MTIPLRNNILRVLGYFDLFDYPLNREEIHSFLDLPVKSTVLNQDLEQLAANAFLFKYGEFYSLRNEPALIKKRVAGNQRAKDLLVRARSISKFLYAFPFVRGVCISGSLSKNFAGEHEDIDYFIITSPNRLWIARTFLHVWKKLSFIRGRQHWYCMNYFIDELALQIEEKNVFTAIEMVTLLPMQGAASLQAFFAGNEWAFNQFPNRHPKPLAQDSGKFYFKRALELLFSNKAGNWLDNIFMRWTGSRWITKERKKKLNMKGSRMGLMTGKHYSKPNPEFFQQKILSSYQANLDTLEAAWTTAFSLQQSVNFS